MKKTLYVTYQSGPSRRNPARAIDYMLVQLPGGLELYAEAPWTPGTESYDGLQAAILQAAEGLDLFGPQFLEVPLYRDPHSSTWSWGSPDWAPGDTYSSLEDYLAATEHSPYYVLGRDVLPEGVEDIRGLVHDEPAHIVVFSGGLREPVYIGLVVLEIELEF